MKKKHKQKTYLTQPQRLTIVVAVVALFLAGYVLYTITKQASPRSNQQSSNEVKPNTTLSMLKNPNDKKIYIHITSGRQPISGVQLALKYDSTAINNVSITPGDFFDNPTILENAIDRQNGIIYYTLSMPTTSAEIFGEGTVAIMQYDEITKNPTKLLFLPQTKITAKGINTSLLKEATPIELP